MLRSEMVDYDTSHAGIAEERWIEGARVVAATPGTSLIVPELTDGCVLRLATLRLRQSLVWLIRSGPGLPQAR